MKKIFSKKPWIVFGSSCVIGIGVAVACAGGDWEYPYENSRFTPEAFVDSSYRPFFYTDLFYYYTGYDENHNSRFNEANVSDWSAWLKKENSKKELTYLLTEAPSNIVEGISSYYKGRVNSLPENVRGYSLFRNKQDEKVTAFVNYLAIAKRCETFSVNERRYAWEDEKPKPAFNYPAVTSELQKMIDQSKDDFLRQRYWFQLVRAHFYSPATQPAIDVFNKYQGQFTQNEMYFRTQAYAAGAYYKQKNLSKANYYYSKVYDGSELLKTVAHYSFHPQEEADWTKTLALCKNKEEQITLWQMTGVFYKDEKRAISEIYKLDPKSNKLDLLVTRAVNKEEQKCLGYSYEQADKPTTDNNNELLTLVGNIAIAGNTAHPYTWYIAAGYLEMLYGNYAKSNAWYAKATSALPANELVKMQLRLLKLVNKTGEAKKIDSKLENELLPELEWLHGFKASAYPDFRYRDAYGWIKYTLAAKYQAQKEWVKAECYVSKPVFYADNKNVEAMKAFLDKTGKTPYEQYYAKLYALNKSQLLEYQAVRLAFEDKLGEAITKMQESGAGTNLPANPFNGRINDCHDCDHAATKKITYSKLSLLQKMKEMEDNVKSGNDIYNNAVLVGNAFYNITHYGNVRAFYESEIIGSYAYSPFSLDSVFRRVLTDMSLPKKYYQLALQAAQTDEQKAKCHYLLAKCERNEWYNQTIYLKLNNEYEVSGSVDFKAWEGFKALQQYPNTKYYNDVINECGYFKTYVSKRK